MNRGKWWGGGSVKRVGRKEEEERGKGRRGWEQGGERKGGIKGKMGRGKNG